MKKNSDIQVLPGYSIKEQVEKSDKRESMIHVRGAFSESMGISGCTMQMQLEEFDDRTRMIISNRLRRLLEFFFEKSGKFNQQIQYKDSYGRNTGGHDFCVYIVSNIFCERINLDEGYSYNWRAIFDKIHNVLTNAPYNEVLDLVWVACEWLSSNYEFHSRDMGEFIYQVMNELFEKEYVGYRFVNGKIVQITDGNEIKEIETACNNPFEGSRVHIQNAVNFLADREKKDYKNSIKESICAVEAVCRIITEEPKAELPKAIKKLKDKGLHLHNALELGFIKLYAYTSDEGGIRHSENLFASNVTFEEAKYMLVSCSAFVNYLIAQYGQLGGKYE